MQHLRTTALFSALAALFTVAYSRSGGRVYRPGEAEEDRKVITDPSARVEGIFKKEGDMTFIMHSDPFRDDFQESGGADSGAGRQKRNAVLAPQNLWPGAVVPYEISSVFNDQDIYVIKSAMRHWEEKTCIRFRPKVAGDQYNIFIMSGPTGVCQSFVGRIHQIYQPQGVTLGQYCVHFSTVLHELGHAIGFYHEHNRPDRDDNIEVDYDNIDPGLHRAFGKVNIGRTNLLGYGYDHASIMHYSEFAFSANGKPTIKANVTFGNAEELSPLDIAKTNTLYNCGPKDTWPPIMTVVPEFSFTLPEGITCGRVSDGQLSGTFTTPGFPSYSHNLDCAFVINVPKGYYVQIELNRFSIETSNQCTKDYVQIYYEAELNPANVARFSGTTQGRICDNRGYNLRYTIFDTTVTVFIHTDSSGSGNRGVNVTFTAIDENECLFGNNCHDCTNYPGGFECTCRDGYYHSAASGTCYDVNECAYDNGDCEHECINFGGSYTCKCNDGFFLQADGKSCDTTPPTPLATTQPPTTTPPAPKCGGALTTDSGSFQTPNWPETYPTDTECEWFITLPDATKLVELSCKEEPYGIAGRHPDCTKDHLTIYDGHSEQSTSYGPYCGFTKPDDLRMSSNLVKVVFYAGPSHSSSRKGIKCTFTLINAPTPPTLPPTTPPTTQPPTTTPPAPKCGGALTTDSGSFQTPNWPETYPTDTECEWRITLPDATKLVELSCKDERYGIAGRHPECTKDHLTIYDGHSEQSTSYGPYCGFTKPDGLLMSSNLATVVFYAGPSHSSSRKGINCTFRSVNAPTPPTLPPTTPPTLPPTTQPFCGGTLTASSGSFSTPNWPSTYPVNIDCTWRITLPDSSRRVEITFESTFGIAGSLPDCTKDTLYVHDDQAGTQYGPFCHFALPSVPVLSSNKARLVFHAGPTHSPSRRGFRATYRSVQ